MAVIPLLVYDVFERTQAYSIIWIDISAVHILIWPGGIYLSKLSCVAS